VWLFSAKLQSELTEAYEKLRAVEGLEQKAQAKVQELVRVTHSRDKLVGMLRTLQTALASVEEQLRSSQAARKAAEAKLRTWLPHYDTYSSAAALEALEAHEAGSHDVGACYSRARPTRRCCRCRRVAAVAAVAHLSALPSRLRCCAAAVAPLPSRRRCCAAAVAPPLLLRCRRAAAAAPLPSCRRCCVLLCAAVAPLLSRRCRRRLPPSRLRRCRRTASHRPLARAWCRCRRACRRARGEGDEVACAGARAGRTARRLGGAP
jgi:hypothetical protein